MQQKDSNGVVSEQYKNDTILLPEIELLEPSKSTNFRHLAEFKHCAFFLDLDGTLLDIAPSPSEVKLEPGLRETLIELDKHTSGALAIVSGRPVGFIDQLFSDYQFSAAGLHGAEIRLARSGVAERAVREVTADDLALFEHARAFAQQSAHKFRGVVFEDKGKAFALHYRQARNLEPVVKQLMRTASELAGTNYAIQEGKFVVELKPFGADKGSALRQIMRHEPFAGKYPIAAGDDITDETMFIAANEMGGVGLRIGPLPVGRKTNAIALAASPALFRHWIRSLTK